ncbi:MAG TPA: DUF488 family protein [Candidatus Limnocylindrales bacterium]|nr:DUF488 family protein [Candidatus Limnocylindrales bacterium]
MKSMTVRIARAYDPPTPDDGVRVLVDRVWPRGLGRDELRIEEWARDVAPSTELRRWFGHDVERWPEFRRRYREELREPDRAAIVRRLAEIARDRTLTLVYSAKDREHNQAVVLAEVIREAVEHDRR